MEPKKKSLTRGRLLEAVSYDPASGEFWWLERTDQTGQWNGRWAGKRAGWTTKNGYRAVEIDGERHYVHRLVFLIMTGEWPDDEVDHINLDKGDNRWSNLRPASHLQNSSNKAVRRDSGTGVKGVQYHKKAGRFMARIRCRGKSHYLGLFDSAEEAGAAYASAAGLLFGDRARA